MNQQKTRQPTVLVPYKGPSNKRGSYDVYVYLRPEANGVQVESALLRVIKNTPHYRAHIELVYLANIPGDFIVQNRIVEKHNSLMLYFIKKGKQAFTPHMRRVFEAYFSTPFSQARVADAFSALELLGLSWEELFKLWVPENDMLVVNGQTIKRKGELFILNYDIPAILHKNNRETDIAVFVFRSTLNHKEFFRMMGDMGAALKQERYVDTKKPISRVFHYSKGPFEEVLDAAGYLFNADGSPVAIREVSFAHYLMNKGLSEQEIVQIMRNPIMSFKTESGVVLEDVIFSYTTFDSYFTAYAKLCSAAAQALVSGAGWG